MTSRDLRCGVVGAILGAAFAIGATFLAPRPGADKATMPGPEAEAEDDQGEAVKGMAIGGWTGARRNHVAILFAGRIEVFESKMQPPQKGTVVFVRGRAARMRPPSNVRTFTLESADNPLPTLD